MSAYVVARFDITDPESAKTVYPRYVEEAAPAARTFDATFIVRGGETRAVEGVALARNVVIAFPDFAAAVGWFRSEVYQAASRHRRSVAQGEMVAVAGVEAVAPAPASHNGGKKGYWIARYDVRDPETHALYIEAAAPAFVEHGACFLARGGAFEALEGTARARNVLIEFPSLQHATDCFRSDTYQRAKRHREN